MSRGFSSSWTRSKLALATANRRNRLMFGSSQLSRLGRSLILSSGLAVMAVVAHAQDAWPSPPSELDDLNAYLETFAPEDFLTSPPVVSSVPGIEKLLFFGDQVYAGDRPPSEESLAALGQLGVRTLVSFDHEPPPAFETMARGMSYVHAPLRMGHLAPGETLKLMRVLTYREGPFYIHGMEGDQRAYVVGALGEMVLKRFYGDRGAAAAWLSSYAEIEDSELAKWSVGEGLFAAMERDVVNELPEDFPRASELPELGWWMRRMKESFEVVRNSREVEWEHPSEERYTTAAYEARTIEQTASRWYSLTSETDEIMKRKMLNVAAFARDLEEALNNQDSEMANRAFLRLSNECRHCHVKFRDYR